MPSDLFQRLKENVDCHNDGIKIILSTAMIYHLWDLVFKDMASLYNCNTQPEFISKIASREVVYGGARVVMTDKIQAQGR